MNLDGSLPNQTRPTFDGPGLAAAFGLASQEILPSLWRLSVRRWAGLAARKKDKGRPHQGASKRERPDENQSVVS